MKDKNKQSIIKGLWTALWGSIITSEAQKKGTA